MDGRIVGNDHQMEATKRSWGFARVQHRRDHLVSAMLQDRRVLRVISAPHGFGKSVLAREYQRRMFPDSECVWIDASSPDFLNALDGDTLLGMVRDDFVPSLIVVDDLPYLDEGRAETFARLVDIQLYRGSEVVVTTVPSHDCLATRHPDRHILRARDMLVSQRETSAKPDEESVEARARAAQLWSRATNSLLGRVASVCWSSDANSAQGCLAGIFSERLPFELVRTMFLMLLLGGGTVEELERCGCALRDENLSILLNDYPFFEFEPVRRVFSIPDFDIAVLYDAFGANNLADALLNGTYPLPQRALGILFERGDIKRARAIMERFCSDDQCGAWLRDKGWELLNEGQVGLVDILHSRATSTRHDHACVLKAMRSWERGLCGNRREAVRYAHAVLSETAGKGDEEEFEESVLAAHLALVAFGKDELGPVDTGLEARRDSMQDPVGFLGCVVDLCTPVEVERALHADDLARKSELEKKRKPASPERAERLRHLFTEASFRMQDNMFFQLSLHLLSFVDDSDLKALVQDLGCDAIISMRGKQLNTLTEALLVRDLWQSGYFGPLGRTTDKRDASLLEGAAQVLKEMAQRAGLENVAVPWEAGSAVGGTSSSIYTGGVVRLDAERVPPVHVRMFGGFEVSVGNRIISETHWKKKARGLFVELVLLQGRDYSRDEVLAAFWPQIARTRALDNFYSTWSSLTSIIGKGPYLERNGDFIRINSHYVVSDVAEFEQLSRALLVGEKDAQILLDTYARLEKLYCGGLLPSDRSSGRVAVQRERYRAMFTDAMVTATHKALEVKDARLALWFGRKAMEVDAKREDVYAALIRAQVAAGQRCSAIRTFFDCRAFLRDELGLDPSFETQNLYDMLIETDPTLLQLSPETFRH